MASSTQHVVLSGWPFGWDCVKVIIIKVIIQLCLGLHDNCNVDKGRLLENRQWFDRTVNMLDCIVPMMMCLVL